jgi:hypothetical protein
LFADAPARRHNVVYLLRQILLGTWQLQLSLQMLQHFLLGKRIALNRRRGRGAFGEIQQMQLLCGRRAQRHTRDVLALR